MYRFLIVIEKTKSNYCAYSPDLPGGIATGKTRAEVVKNMYEAVELHIKGYIEDHSRIPRPNATTEYVSVL